VGLSSSARRGACTMVDDIDASQSGILVFASRRSCEEGVEKQIGVIQSLNEAILLFRLKTRGMKAIVFYATTPREATNQIQFLIHVAGFDDAVARSLTDHERYRPMAERIRMEEDPFLDLSDPVFRRMFPLDNVLAQMFK
jgi:hypothetical protein